MSVLSAHSASLPTLLHNRRTTSFALVGVETDSEGYLLVGGGVARHVVRLGELSLRKSSADGNRRTAACGTRRIGR